jgi:hypothetical protein
MRGAHRPIAKALGGYSCFAFSSVGLSSPPGATLLAAPGLAQVVPFPPSFHTQDIETNGTTIHVRVGG